MGWANLWLNLKHGDNSHAASTFACTFKVSDSFAEFKDNDARLAIMNNLKTIIERLPELPFKNNEEAKQDAIRVQNLLLGILKSQGYEASSSLTSGAKNCSMTIQKSFVPSAIPQTVKIVMI